MASTGRAAPEASAIDWPGQIYEVFRAHGIRQVAHVPDAGHSKLIRLCEADSAMRVVTLTTEEEGVALLAGAWLGGARGALLMQSSGVGNTINTLSLVKHCRMPFLTLITMRGEWGEFNPWQVPMGQATRPSLAAQGIVVYDVTSADAIKDTVEAAAKLAFDSTQQVAVTISQRVIGTKAFKD
ncbi:MAG: thiamine pyrophosphate-binding protein [Alphaproteobacteria bacterium]